MLFIGIASNSTIVRYPTRTACILRMEQFIGVPIWVLYSHPFVCVSLRVLVRKPLLGLYVRVPAHEGVLRHVCVPFTLTLP